ncbi:unnamed protein product [Cuscuta campestris]|uniref:CCHC-type domain-containing protein n=1 Tax=Cuscuta campestris TaxID=132261 RepID=A0A484LPM1_9ASTE|nr:unnamed protein product [Cuscuta campestris]
MVNNMDHGLPKFSLLGYDDWKTMMEAHLYALHDCMWMVLEEGPLKIQMENPERDPNNPDVVKYIPKPKDKWDDRDCKKHNLDNVAKAAIFKTLYPITFSKIKHLKTAMEIWQGLGKLCEGSKDMRKQKIQIINDLHVLGKAYSNKDLIRKILRSLTPEWRSKADAIYESIGNTNVTIDGLRGNLKTYESTILKPSLDKSHGLALKASSSKRVEVSDSDSDDDNPSYNLLEKFQEFLKEELGSRDCKRKGEPVPTCFGCGELGHIKPYCPNRKEKKKKERAYMAWDSESSGDETATLCLKPHERNGESQYCGQLYKCLYGAGRLGHGFGLAIYPAMVDITHPRISDPGIPEPCHPAMGDITHPWEATKYPGVWYLDNGCSRHMTGDASLLSNLIPYDGPRFTFGGSNDFGLTKGLGNLVYKGLTIQAVSYVEGLNYNLLSISQFCDKGYSLEFYKDMASLKNISTNKVILTGKRIRNIYEVLWDDVKEACLISKGDTNLLWLWHKRLSHLNFKTLNKLSKKGLVEVDKPSKHDHEVLDLSNKDEEVNEGDRMKPMEFIPFESLSLKTTQRSPDSDCVEPTGNHDQPSEIPDLSHGDNSGSGDPVPTHPETPTNSILQPEAEQD